MTGEAPRRVGIRMAGRAASEGVPGIVIGGVLVAWQALLLTMATR